MFNLEVKISENLGLVPPIIGYLASIPEGGLSYRFYRLRHPGGIFNIQFGSAVADLLEVSKYINKLTPEEIHGKNWDTSELIRKFTLSLFSFARFFNSAYEIILGCCREEKDIPNKEVWKWLKNKGYDAGEKYYNLLSELRETLDIFNELKHSSTRFGIVALQRSIDSANILGYYVSSVNNAGAIIPNEKYHPQMNGEHTATSFSLRLRAMYYGIYKASDVLLTALKEHFIKVHGQELKFNFNRKESNELTNELFHQIDSLPLVLFPNEKSKLVPIARKVKRSTDKYLIFKKEKIPIPISRYHIISNLPPPDGFSRSWGIPYFKRKS